MKTASSKTGISFGFSAVNAGQRNTTVEPQLIAVSTDGNFRITPAVSKVLGIGHGENLMFLSNVDNLDAAIVDKDANLVAFVSEAGLEWGSPEALVAIHKEFDEWAIAKGIQEYDPKGNVKTGTERLTKNDKAKKVASNFEQYLESVLADTSAETEEAREALGREGITKEEQIDILSIFVQANEEPKFKGSKTANPGGRTGAGVSLTFTDSNVWKQIKIDMGEDASKLNRVFDVDIEDVQTVEISNGYEIVKVKALVLGDYTDKEPARVGEKEAAE